MVVIGKDLKRLLSRIRSDGTRARTMLNEVIRKAGNKRVNGGTVKDIGGALQKSLRHIRKIAETLDDVSN